jgi:hypothetical protein
LTPTPRLLEANDVDTARSSVRNNLSNASVERAALNVDGGVGWRDDGVLYQANSDQTRQAGLLGRRGELERLEVHVCVGAELTDA